MTLLNDVNKLLKIDSWHLYDSKLEALEADFCRFLKTCGFCKCLEFLIFCLFWGIFQIFFKKTFHNSLTSVEATTTNIYLFKYENITKLYKLKSFG